METRVQHGVSTNPDLYCTDQGEANTLRVLVDLIHSTTALWMFSVFTIVDVRIAKSGTFSL